ncbi:MAG: ABC transporter permease [Bacteroidetes bacterium]|nr:ABC transporter permease [Bacteroidota bacterium]
MNNKRILISSLRILFRNKLNTLFMILGIFIGIAALTLTFSIGKGTEKQLMDNVKKQFSSNNIYIGAGRGQMGGGPTSQGPANTLKIDDLEAIMNNVAGIIMYDPVQWLPAKEVIAGGNNVTTMIKGHSVESEIIWNRTVQKGQFFSKAEEKSAARVALIGSKLATELFGNSDPIEQQFRIGNIPFTVKGILEDKGVDAHGFDMDMDVIIPITTMMKRVMNVDYIMSASLMVENVDQMDETVFAITDILRERHYLSENETNDFSIMTPVEVKSVVEDMNKVFTLVLPLITGIALLVGGIIIVVMMLMSVSRRISEIGLRKAVGARKKDISFQFFIEASLVSLLGGVLGIIIGTIGTKLLASSMDYTFVIPWQTLILGVLIPVSIGMIAGIVPAKKASKQDPIEALN